MNDKNHLIGIIQIPCHQNKFDLKQKRRGETSPCKNNRRNDINTFRPYHPFLLEALLA